MANDKLIYASAARKAILKADPKLAYCIDNIKGVDAVEVVRCKDCKWFNHPGCAIYIVDDTDKPKEDDFCSYGERRNDGNT